jgi:hypothetical protein
MNFQAVFKGIGYLIQYFVSPTPQQIAIKAFAGEALPFLKYLAAYPRAKQLEDSATAVAISFGAQVHVDQATGHIISVDPPAPIDAGGRPTAGANRGGLMPPGV